ncbi:hypothetical protein H8356DRAFT_1294369 [Neocallimastix lanati (nom. inval.)]|nr:hypothetical protein H8356DRAFT_1294369 [Neocallimastix sp. JGI-2020a]
MNNLEYYKNKKNSEVIKYLKEYKLYNEDNFKSDEIITLICLIIKNCNLTKLEKKKTLELVLNELFENYKYDRDYEFNDYFKYNNEFILKLLLYYKNKIKISRIEFELILIKEKEDKCNSVINFNILNSYKYFSFDCDLNRYDIRCRKIVNPLFLAYYFSLSDIVDMLINKYGAYVYIKDNEGNTLLHIYGGVNKIISLINNEYHINVINNKGETPLHKACIQYNYVTNCLIYKLLKYGANINAQDNEGNTPLINLPYNHLDLQIALLILLAGDHNGNIVKGLDGKPLKINISINNSNNNKYIKDITEIIPSLKKVKSDLNNFPDEKSQNSEIERRFKELYKLAEIIACDRLSYQYIEHSDTQNDPYRSELYARYNDPNNNNLPIDPNTNEKITMEMQFEEHMKKIDIFRKLTGITLIDSDKELNIISIYNRKAEKPIVEIEQINKEHQYYNNYNVKEFIRNGVIGNNNNILKLYKEENNLMDVDSDIYILYKAVGESCIDTEECYKLFLDKGSDGKYEIIKENIDFTLIEENNGNKNKNILHFIVKDTVNDKIYALELNYNDKKSKYEIDKSKIKSLILTNVNSDLSGYGKQSFTGINENMDLIGQIKGKGIHIIPESGVILERVIEGRHIDTYNPDDYIDNNKENDEDEDSLKEIVLDLIVQRNPTYDNNDNLLCSYNELIKDPENFDSIMDKSNLNLNTAIENIKGYLEEKQSSIKSLLKKNWNEIIKNDKNEQIKEKLKKERVILSNENTKIAKMLKQLTKIDFINDLNKNSNNVEKYDINKIKEKEEEYNNICNKLLSDPLKDDYEEYQKNYQEIIAKNEKLKIIANFMQYDILVMINNEIINEKNDDFLAKLNANVEKKYTENKINQINKQYKNILRVIEFKNKNKKEYNSILTKVKNTEEYKISMNNIMKTTYLELDETKKKINHYMTYNNSLDNYLLNIDELEKEYTTEKKIIRDLSKQNLIEKLQPVSKNISENLEFYKFVNIINDMSHNDDLTPSIELVNEANKLTIDDQREIYKQCKLLFKRSLSSCRTGNQIKISKELTISFTIINTLKTFKIMDLNSNILPYTSNINDINDIKMLVKDAESINEVLNTLAETYKNNIDKFDKEQSEKFIRNFNSITNDQILEYTNSDYNNNNNEMNEENVNKLISSYFEIINIHKENFGNIYDIELYSLDSHDSQSKLNKNKLNKIIEKLSKMAGINPNTVLNSDDSLSAINELCEELEKLENIEDINSIYNELNDLKSINELELYKNDKTSLNSEIVHKLYNTIVNKNNMKIDDEINSSENNLRVLNNNKENILPDKHIEEITLKLLRIFKDKNIDKNILPIQYEVDNLSNPKLIYKNAECLVNVWKDLSTTYNKNFENFSEKESTDFIVGFNNIINELKSMLSSSKYNNDLNVKNINSNDIEKLEKYFNRDYSLHKDKFNIIRDNKGNEMVYTLKYTKDLNSKYYRKNIIINLNKLLSIVNINNGNLIYGLGVMFEDGKISSEIDYRSIGEGNNLNEALNSLCELTETLDISSLSEDHKNELRKIYENFHDMMSIVNEEYYKGKISDNSHAIYKLHNSLAILFDEDTFVIDDINNSLNKIVDPDLEPLEGKNAIDQGIKIKELRSYAGNELYILSIVSLSSNYNDLVATAICYDRILSSDINNNIPISTLEFDKELDNRVRYLITNKLNSVISSTAKNNPKIYNINSKFTKEDKFSWGDSIVYALSESSLINMFYDKSNIKSKSDVLSHLIKDSNIESYDSLGYSVELNYQYANYQSPGSINSKDANAVTHNYNKLHDKLIKNIQPLDEFQNEIFSEAIDEVMKYNPNIESKITENANIKIEVVFNEISEYDDKIKESITDDTKKHIETTINKFTIYVVGSYYKFAKMLGRENQVTIDDYKSYFNNNIKYVSNYITKNNINLNNKPLVISIKPNMNNINSIHNYCISKNNILNHSKKHKAIF